MPRKSRIDALGALHHLIARGIERRKIFSDDQDHQSFIDRLGLVLTETGTACYAWALIPNHFHLLLRTGAVPITTVMRRLLTGHAISYNHRHRRHGHLFQNRYKSILCQEDAYLLELVRYIHLNPLRAKLVKDMGELGRYPFCGHSVIMGKQHKPWQDIDTVLAYFGKQRGPARRSYRVFVGKGIGLGRRPDLTGGGLVRSAGGWVSVKALKKAGAALIGDERILGNGEFVEKALDENQEVLERRYALRTKGVDVDLLAHHVAKLFEMKSEALWQPGRYRQLVRARSVLCYWAVRELGESMTAMAGRLKISTAAVSKAVRRGAEIVSEERFKLNISL
jgi:REP element-mobilizing transposase RayT